MRRSLSGLTSLTKRLLLSPPFSLVTKSRWAGHLVATLRLAPKVRERVRFFANEMRGAKGPRRYHLRRARTPVLVRHRHVDVYTLLEMEALGMYDPPPAAAAVLAELEHEPAVLDLGANIGLFGAAWRDRFPGSSIVAFEPDPENIEIHRRLIAISGADDRWRLVEAAATTAEGSVHFAAQDSVYSHVSDGATATSIEVRAVDCLPEIQRADVLKMDIEGSEWELLRDDRFAGPRVIVLEYHPGGAGTPDTHTEIERLLDARGYDFLPGERFEDGRGTGWAIRHTPKNA